MQSFHNYLRKKTEKDPSLKAGMQMGGWILEVSFQVSQLRKKHNYSQTEFARKLGVAQSAVARIESGQNMRLSTLWKISEVFDVDLEIFGASKETEKQELANFCVFSVEDKGISGSTANKNEFKFGLQQPSALIPSYSI